jgi:hypothetical protein
MTRLSTADLLNDLALRNRAYNLLYSLGDYTSSNVPTLAPGEAARLILAAHEAQHGDRSTVLHRRIAQLPAHQLHYAVTGRIEGRNVSA